MGELQSKMPSIDGHSLNGNQVGGTAHTTDAFPAPHTETKYYPAQQPLDKDRPVKVCGKHSSSIVINFCQAIIIGAGISGVAAALLLSKKVRNIDLAVYDRHSKIGGTWAANIYPGVRCDVPSHSYQLRSVRRCTDDDTEAY